jgi:hypothetical protein
VEGERESLFEPEEDAGRLTSVVCLRPNSEFLMVWARVLTARLKRHQTPWRLGAPYSVDISASVLLRLFIAGLPDLLNELDVLVGAGRRRGASVYGRRPLM